MVWEGLIPGIYEDWASCKAQIEGFKGAQYKSFESREEAEKVFREGYKRYYAQRRKGEALQQIAIFPKSADQPILNSLSVDAACNMVTRVMEYRGVDTRTKREIFRMGPFQGGTNNIGEFLALVHGLALLHQQGSKMLIYSDSVTAISWVRKKKHKSIVLPTEENRVLFDLLDRAEKWLHTHTFDNPIVKWNTAQWGEIPADFGRK